jgi:ribokinase
MSKPVIAVVGSAMMDLTAYSDKLPNAGQTIVGNEFTTGFGGKGANQAVAAANSGADVYFIGNLGNDVFGDAIYENFKNRNLNLQYLERSEAPTGVAHIWVDQNGENRIIIIPGANHQIDKKLTTKAIKEIADLKVLIGQCEIRQEITLAAFQVAKSLGVTTILNPAPYEALSSELIAVTDWIIPNESEYAELGQVDAEVILTLGEKGARYLNLDLHVDAIKVVPVDTTGAGDAFVGTFATALASGAEIKDAMRLGCIAAGLSVTKKGAQSSYPSYAEISTFS